ncbi:hypothetical protein M8C21_003464, partial [Ambrosia artemisiifolia]
MVNQASMSLINPRSTALEKKAQAKQWAKSQMFAIANRTPLEEFLLDEQRMVLKETQSWRENPN